MYLQFYYYALFELGTFNPLIKRVVNQSRVSTLVWIVLKITLIVFIAYYIVLSVPRNMHY